MREETHPRVCKTVALAAALLAVAGSTAAIAQSASAGGGSGLPLTVERSISLRRILKNPSENAAPIKISPDGHRYVIVLIHGDVVRDGNWVEILSGRLDSLAAAVPMTVARLFTTSAGVPPLLDREIEWIDNNRIAFLWDDGVAPICVMELDLSNQSLGTLITHPTDVSNFSISPDGRTVVYSAAAAESERADKDKQLLHDGFAVADGITLNDLLKGTPTGNPAWHQHVYVRSQGSAPPVMVPLPDTGVTTIPAFLQLQLAVSPDGLHAIATAPPAALPDSWRAYQNDRFMTKLMALHRSPSEPSDIEQLWLIDISHPDAHPLLNAPIRLGGTNVAWSPDSREVLIGPTFLPLQSFVDPAARVGDAVAVVDIGTGQFSQLGLPVGLFVQVGDAILWHGPDEIEIRARRTDAPQSAQVELEEIVKFRRVGADVWQLEETGSAQLGEITARIRLQLRENLNEPPRLYAVDRATRQEKLLLDVDPELHGDIQLGRVATVLWVAEDGKRWSGILYYPVHYDRHRRFPLVIKGGRVLRHHFSFVGDDLNMTAGGAQAMAARDIAVLIADVPDDGMPDARYTPLEFSLVTDGYEAAIKHLVDTGLADPQRIGVTGVSRWGDRAAHFVTQSRIPIAAALLADNLDDSYLQYLEWGSQVGAAIAKDIGAEPVGEGWKSWLQRAPGFNADKIHAPLRLERDSRGLIGTVDSWELYSRLRYLNKPVELYFIPDIAHGTHQLTKPSQLLASQGAAVDWFDYWLNDHEDPTPSKEQQYVRWRRLRTLHDADLKDRSE